MLRNNLHYALLAVVRRWRRNLLTVLAMLAGTTTIIMLVGVSESSALNTSSQLASYDSTRLGVRSSRRPGIYRRMNCSGALTKFQRSKLPVQSPSIRRQRVRRSTGRGRRANRHPSQLFQKQV